MENPSTWDRMKNDLRERAEKEQNAAPQEQLAKSAEDSSVNGTDKPGETGLTPAGAAPIAHSKSQFRRMTAQGASPVIEDAAPSADAGEGLWRTTELLEELRIEAAIVPNRRGELYSKAADAIAALQRQVKAEHLVRDANRIRAEKAEAELARYECDLIAARTELSNQRRMWEEMITVKDARIAALEKDGK